MSRKLEYEDNKLYEYDYRLVGIFNRTWQDVRITNPERLCFPQDRREAHYRVGDFIFVRDSWSISEARQHYKEFAERLDSEHSWGSFFVWLMGMSDITIGKEIVEINGTTGNFSVVMKSYLIIPGENDDDDERLQLHYIDGNATETQSRTAINNTYNYTSVIHSTRAIRPAAIAMLHVISLPFGGAARAAGTRAMRGLMQRFGPRIIKRILPAAVHGTVLRILGTKVVAKTAAFCAKIARDTAINIAREYGTETRNNELRRAVDANAVQSTDLSHLILHAFRDAVADNISGELRSAMGSVVPEGAADGLFDSSTSDKITEYLTRELFKEMAEPINRVVKASILAVDFSDDSSYSQRLGDKIESELLSHYRGRLQGLVEAPAKKLFENPDRLF